MLDRELGAHPATFLHMGRSGNGDLGNQSGYPVVVLALHQVNEFSPRDSGMEKSVWIHSCSVCSQVFLLTSRYQENGESLTGKWKVGALTIAVCGLHNYLCCIGPLVCGGKYLKPQGQCDILFTFPWYPFINKPIMLDEQLHELHAYGPEMSILAQQPFHPKRSCNISSPRNIFLQ